MGVGLEGTMDQHREN